MPGAPVLYASSQNLFCGPELLVPAGLSLFFKREMELSLIGLQNAGKSSLVNVLTTGQFQEDMIPTVGTHCS